VPAAGRCGRASRRAPAGNARGCARAAWLALRLAEEAGDEARLAGLAAAGPLLARGLDGECVVRRSRPEGLFASVEVTRPWLSCALLGVNERGLAVAGVAPTPDPGGKGAAPALLLAQDCLERFEALEAAMEWCLGRPAAGPATLLLADARGDVAGVEIAGDERRVLRPEAGVLVCEKRAAGGDLAKLLRDAGLLDAAALARRIGGAAIDVRERLLVVDGAEFSP
jgi:hypothetical protein